jgi:hypothetical protein
MPRNYDSDVVLRAPLPSIGTVTEITCCVAWQLSVGRFPPLYCGSLSRGGDRRTLERIAICRER